MNKKACFILLPILAILISFHGRANNVILGQAAEYNITGVSLHKHAPGTFNLTKDNNRRQKNKIRIKAWDDCFAMDVAETWEQSPRIYFYDKPVYRVYSFYFQSAHFTRYNLRGPPSINC